jgi:hypothetical protein
MLIVSASFQADITELDLVNADCQHPIGFLFGGLQAKTVSGAYPATCKSPR